MNQETVYGWLAGKKYEELRDFLFRGKDKIKNDPMLSAAAKMVELELARLSNDEMADEEFRYTLETLHTFHPKFYEIQSDNFKKITLNLAIYHKNNVQTAIRFAKLFPEEEISQEIIKLHSETETQIIEHDREEHIKITHNPIPINIKSSTPLFKSTEEQKLYLALRRIFDTYLVYPNVAMSNVINFEAINGQLNQNERNYFYKSVIDFVVFDQFKGYEPIYFLELDSVWHDLDKVEEKDKMKDKIFSIAGLKLIRIRHKANRPIDEDTFVELVEEIRTQV
jgi:very-short-patch-repair endonuclease